MSAAAVVLVALAAPAVLYARGLHRIRRQAGPGRVVAGGQVGAFACGLALLAAALLPPVEPVAHDLFAVHMVQHLLLGLAAPLLLQVGAPLTVVSWAVDPQTRRVLHRWARRATARLGVAGTRSAPTTAIAAVTLHAAVFWVWHVPSLYEAAVAQPFVHAVEHASLFATGLLFAWVVVGTRWRVRSGLALLYLFVSALQGGALAALLTFAPRPLYDSHVATAPAWGLTALEDQQLAGAIMWVPGGFLYAAVAAALFVGWLRSGPAPHRPTFAGQGL